MINVCQMNIFINDFEILEYFILTLGIVTKFTSAFISYWAFINIRFIIRSWIATSLSKKNFPNILLLFKSLIFNTNLFKLRNLLLLLLFLFRSLHIFFGLFSQQFISNLLLIYFDWRLHRQNFIYFLFCVRECMENLILI